MIEGNNRADAIANLISRYARHEVESRPVATMAKITELSDDGTRATVELLAEPESKSSNVPITTPFANGTEGDSLPLEPGVKGIVIFLDHPVDEQLESGGTESDRIGMDIEDAVFLPAFVTTDDETVTDHDDGSRVISHPSGSSIELGEDGSITLRHPDGSTIETAGEAEPDDSELMPEGWSDDSLGEPEREMVEQWSRDNTSYPSGGRSRLRHDDGGHVTVDDHGVALGEHEASDRRGVHIGQPNDPERRELDGDHQHFHLLEHSNGEVSLVGPQLSFREFLAWMVDDDRQASLRNADQYAEARSYAEDYLAWLEGEVGDEYSLDPTDPATWPHEQPMPTPDEKENFGP